MMTAEPLIALEIHDVTLWEPSRVLPTIETMERWGYNALVLHQNDLLDFCTQLGLTANYGVSDLRLKKVRNAAAWLNRLTDRLSQFGARLFLEIKEPSYHPYALESYPGLLGAGGQPDPTSPSWAAFCEAKTRDLLARVPDLGGLIVNLSSPESQVSLPDYLATHGRALDKSQWFERMIGAFQGPLAEQGKSLYIRDFSYTKDMQSGVLQAINGFDGRVGASVKITAHDYFPEFPENPGAQMVDAPLIFEFEAFGEHMGWGVIPNCRVAEFGERMKGYRKLGAQGILMRTSWEAISGANALDTLSAVNVFALPKLVQADADPKALVLSWLEEEFQAVGDVANQAADLMLESWRIPAASYWNGMVFPRHSCLPSTWQEGWLSMASSGMGRRDRDLGIDPDDPMLSEKARVRLFADKEAGAALAQRLAAEANALMPELPVELARQFTAFEWLQYFARQFELAIKATFFAVRGSKEDRGELPVLGEELLALADDLAQKLYDAGDIPHHHTVLLDPKQIRLFVRSLPG